MCVVRDLGQVDAGDAPASARSSPPRGARAASASKLAAARRRRRDRARLTADLPGKRAAYAEVTAIRERASHRAQAI